MRTRKFSPGDQVVLTEEAVKSLTDKRVYGKDAYTYPPRTIFTVCFSKDEYTSDVYIYPETIWPYGDVVLWNEVWLKKWQ